MCAAVVRDLRLPDIVATLIEPERARLSVLGVKDQVNVLSLPLKTPAAFTKDFDHPAVADHADGEAEHGVVLAIQRFRTHPNALACWIVIGPGHHGYVA